MRKLESFKSEIFTKEEMKKINGGLVNAGPTKTNCDGTTTQLPDCSYVQDCGDRDNID